MLRFNFILGLNFISLWFGVWLSMITSLKQREIKFKPRIKLNHNIYTRLMFPETKLSPSEPVRNSLIDLFSLFVLFS